jgi:hypothetical protein
MVNRGRSEAKTGKSTVSSSKKLGGGAERYSVRTRDGVITVKPSASSTAIMDKTVERYAKAMKRLAKR